MINKSCNNPITEMDQQHIKIHIIKEIHPINKIYLIKGIPIIKDIKRLLFPRKDSMISLKKLKCLKCPKIPEKTILKIRKRKYKEINPYKEIISCSKQEKVDKEEVKSLIDIYYILIYYIIKHI